MHQLRERSPPVVISSLLNGGVDSPQGEFDFRTKFDCKIKRLHELIAMLLEGAKFESDTSGGVIDMPGTENVPTPLLWYKSLLRGKVNDPRYEESRQHL